VNAPYIYLFVLAPAALLMLYFLTPYQSLLVCIGLVAGAIYKRWQADR
jgi:hypothetical protein